MTKTTELAKKYADDYSKCCDDCCDYETYTDIKDAYRNGAQDMLERVCEWLKMNTDWTDEWDDFGRNIDFGKIDELRKDIEE